MVLGWTNGENSVIKGILDKIAALENKVKLLERVNEEQKQEILTLRNGNACTEWRDVLIGKKKKLSGNQESMANDILTEHNEREIRENRLVLFGVPSAATSDEERKKEDEATILAIFEEIGLKKDSIIEVKRFKANPIKTAASKPLPVRIRLTGCCLNEVLKKAKTLKNSVKFKSVFFNKDLTAVQINRLKQLIKTRNTENAKLDAKNKETKAIATYRYGIRNDMVVKVSLNKT
jgi:hypothetical protein